MSDLNLWKRQWRDELLAKAKSERDEILRSYQSFKNKNTEYARSQKMVLDVREQVLKVWEQSPADLPGEVCGNCDTALPAGCSGTFRDDGEHCLLNRKAS